MKRCIIVRAGRRGYWATIHEGTPDSYYPRSNYGSARRPSAAWAKSAAARKLRRLMAREARAQRRDSMAASLNQSNPAQPDTERGGRP